MSRQSPIDRAAKFLRPKIGRPEAAVILGSGLGGVLRARGRDIPYAKIPGFPRPTAAGHAGVLSAGGGIAVLRGRVHLYEGRTAEEVARPVRVLAQLGVKLLLITNAAGGVNPAYRPGDLMVIRDHINLTGATPLEGFCDMSRAYDPGIVRGVRRRGVYAAVRGPSYETPAEARMLRRLGADAVGMSTVIEVLAAVGAGMRVAGVSCITNRAGARTDHEAVTRAAAKAGAALGRVLEKTLRARKRGPRPSRT
ncbi:MAG: purine-nucleoside phosphorylase [Planctomycetota bacterium]|jgi:purine-nucleoside phosphorylase